MAEGANVTNSTPLFLESKEKNFNKNIVLHMTIELKQSLRMWGPVLNFIY